MFLQKLYLKTLIFKGGKLSVIHPWSFDNDLTKKRTAINLLKLVWTRDVLTIFMNNFQLSYSGLSESPTYIMSPKFLAIILKRAIFNCAYFQVMFENNDIYYIQSILLHDIFSAKKRGLSAMLRPGNDQRI